jgi:hypothetical protein
VRDPWNGSNWFMRTSVSELSALRTSFCSDNFTPPSQRLDNYQCACSSKNGREKEVTLRKCKTTPEDSKRPESE